MTTCLVCTTHPRARGFLCRQCLAPIAAPGSLLPEHVVSRARAGRGACLVDPWGRRHWLSTRTLVGRKDCDLRILSASVSRHHAELRLDGSRWLVMDLGSRNGTEVGAGPISAPTPLAPGQVVRFGAIGFVLAAAPAEEDEPALMSSLQTAGQTAGQVAAAGGGPPVRFSFALHEPSAGGGGVIEVQGRTIPLALAQFRLLQLLRDRLAAEADMPFAVRGFVPSPQLIASLPWDCAYPNEGHLKQLVRRLRLRLAATPVEIESAQGLGYRLRAG